jgi:AraC-like DNA-binding protein
VELEVHILPPFWMTKSFKIIFLVLLLAILVLAYKLRLKSIERRTKYVKQKVEELSAELINKERESKNINPERKDLVDEIDSLSYPRTKLEKALIPWGNKIKTIEGKFTARDIEFINQVNLFIDENLHDSTFSIELLSKKVNMSRATFYRKFTELTDMKPADYIKHIRLKKAFHLLENEDYTVAQAAECVGFQSESHFRKSFKLEFGITPSSIKG